MMSKHAPKIGEHGARVLTTRALVDRINDISDFCVIWEMDTKAARRKLDKRMAKLQLTQLDIVQTKLNILRNRLSEIAL